MYAVKVMCRISSKTKTLTIMKLKNIFGLMLLSVLTLSSCSDDDDYVKGNQTNENGYNVYFSADNSASLAIGMNDTEIEIKLERDITENSAALTVPVNYNVIDAGAFTAPKSVTFNEGETEAVIKVAVNPELEMFKNYMLSLSIPEEYTNQYDAESGAPKFLTTIVKEDYKPAAYGVYNNWYYEQEWEQVLDYSEVLGLYRLTDVIYEGTSFYFYWNLAEDGTQTCYFTDSKGNKVDSFFSGIVHSTYGKVNCNVLYNNPTGMLQQNVFYFPFQWVVSAGSFGAGYDTYTVTEWVNN